ncbi:unnamed protein product [Acanthosepion pharaonis]|uniref:Uncharacterized protein n=1 Tax=Acanthosepion pharaonis TaxID=158019 RepID=A0A812CN73_ACAPH|nr:unnamed protein product [Sepia pharaonis]
MLSRRQAERNFSLADLVAVHKKLIEGMPFSLSACPRASLPTCLSTSFSICLTMASLCICFPVHYPFSLSACPLSFLAICLSTILSRYLPPFSLSACPLAAHFVCLFTSLSHDLTVYKLLSLTAYLWYLSVFDCLSTSLSPYLPPFSLPACPLAPLPICLTMASLVSVFLSISLSSYLPPLSLSACPVAFLPKLPVPELSPSLPVLLRPFSPLCLSLSLSPSLPVPEPFSLSASFLPLCLSTGFFPCLSVSAFMLASLCVSSFPLVTLRFSLSASLTLHLPAYNLSVCSFHRSFCLPRVTPFHSASYLSSSIQLLLPCMKDYTHKPGLN